MKDHGLSHAIATRFWSLGWVFQVFLVGQHLLRKAHFGIGLGSIHMQLGQTRLAPLQRVMLSSPAQGIVKCVPSAHPRSRSRPKCHCHLLCENPPDALSAVHSRLRGTPVCPFAGVEVPSLAPLRVGHRHATSRGSGTRRSRMAAE